MLDVKTLLPLMLGIVTGQITAPAKDGTNAINSFGALSPELRATVKAESGPAVAPARRAYLTTAGTSLAFLVPSGFSLVPGEPGCLKVSTADGVIVIEFRILPALASEDALRKTLATYPEAEVVENLVSSFRDRPCHGREFRWSPQQGATSRGRLWALALPGETITLCVSAPAASFEIALRGFNTVLATLVSAPTTSELPVMPLSELL